MKREEAIKLIDTHTVCFYNEIDSPTLQALHMAIEALKRKPILCSHCKHYIRHDHRCGWWNHGVSNVDWCSYAERREP